MTDLVREAIHRVVTAQEAQDYLETPVSEREREDVLALARWFRRRYATPADRLAYVRRAYARWLQTSGRSGGPSPVERTL